jgi:hypothetical protein
MVPLDTEIWNVRTEKIKVFQLSKSLIFTGKNQPFNMFPLFYYECNQF